MKCSNCHKEILGKVAYFKAKPVCPRCFEKLSWSSKRVRLEQEKLKERGLITHNPQRALLLYKKYQRIKL